MEKSSKRNKREKELNLYNTTLIRLINQRRSPKKCTRADDDYNDDGVTMVIVFAMRTRNHFLKHEFKFAENAIIADDVRLHNSLMYSV